MNLNPSSRTSPKLKRDPRADTSGLKPWAPATPPLPARSKALRGMTLVELMVAIAVASLILAVIATASMTSRPLVCRLDQLCRYGRQKPQRPGSDDPQNPPGRRFNRVQPHSPQVCRARPDQFLPGLPLGCADWLAPGMEHRGFDHQYPPDRMRATHLLPLQRRVRSDDEPFTGQRPQCELEVFANRPGPEEYRGHATSPHCHTQLALIHNKPFLKNRATL